MDLRDCHLPMKRLGTQAWLAALLGESTSLAINPLFVGTRQRDDRWSCEDRRVDGHWVLLVLEGRCVGHADGAPLALDPGSVMWAPPGIRHTLQWSQRLRYSEVYFSVTAQRSNVAHPQPIHLTPHSRLITTSDADPLGRSLDRIADEVQLGGAYVLTRLRSLIAVMCIDILRLAQTSGGDRLHPGGGAGLTRAQQSRLLQLTRERGCHLVPTDLADCLGLSHDYFSRRFHHSFGISPRVWLNRRQIDTAAALLEQTSLPVYQIADQLGYAGVAQFSRQFKRVTGASPAAYRRRSCG